MRYCRRRRSRSRYVRCRCRASCLEPFAGYFPRLILLLPHAIVLSVLLAMHPATRGREQVGNLSPKVVQPMPPTLPSEGSADWLANLQAIQNLMGAV